MNHSVRLRAICLKSRMWTVGSIAPDVHGLVKCVHITALDACFCESWVCGMSTYSPRHMYADLFLNREVTHPLPCPFPSLYPASYASIHQLL